MGVFDCGTMTDASGVGRHIGHARDQSKTPMHRMRPMSVGQLALFGKCRNDNPTCERRAVRLAITTSRSLGMTMAREHRVIGSGAVAQGGVERGGVHLRP
jgi:hypothetical protein